MENPNSKIGEYWSEITKHRDLSGELRLRWWDSPYLVQHYNKLVCGEMADGISQGMINLVKEYAGEMLPFKKGISVGGGNGSKEMMLIKQGIVESIDLYELSKERIIEGTASAKEQSLEENIHFIHGDAFQLVTSTEEYDFVHWNNSLHHMLDTDLAVRWSKNILKTGGLFYMDDFVGANRFQWSDKQLEIASKVRQVFNGSKYLRNPKNQDAFLSTLIDKPDKEGIIRSDPSEAADSENIIASIEKYFPGAVIKYTGGVIYHLALANMIHNFDDKDDKMLLDLLMIIDGLCVEAGQTHYAIAIAFKHGPQAT